MKYVKYNGRRESYYGCSNPGRLIMGQVYKVIKKNDLGYQTNYSLKGVDGEYNSLWFDELPTYLAFGKEFPKVGRILDIVRQEPKNGKMYLAHVHTTSVKEVEQLSANTYLTVTENTLYIVQVLF